MTKKRIMAVILAALVLIVMVSSSLYIAEHADHDCTGEDCSICQQIYLCTQTLKTLSLAVIAAAVFYAFSALLSITDFSFSLPGSDAGRSGRLRENACSR